MIEVFKEGEIKNNKHMVTNGVEAMEFLHRKNKHSDAVRPDLILLDLNLLKKDGRQVLQEIKEDPQLKQISLIVLTTSQSEWDINHTYKNYANAYLTKLIDLNKFIKVIKSIEHYWFNTVTLPPK